MAGKKKRKTSKSPASRSKKRKSPAKREPSRREKLKLVATLPKTDGLEAFLFDPEKLWSRVEDYTSTRNLAVDAAIRVPGFPAGRFVEVAGPEGTGKTTIVLQALAEAQARGGVAILADAEHAVDVTYLKKLGVDLDELIMVQADSVEQVFAGMAEIVPKARAAFPGVPIIFAWDSLAGTGTLAEMEAEMGKQFRAEAAKVINSHLRRYAPVVGQHQTTFIIVNRVYRKMGNSYVEEYETYGGSGVKYVCTIRLQLHVVGRLWPRGWNKESHLPPVGQIVEVRVVKNKLAAQDVRRRFAIRYGEGVDNLWTLWNDLQKTGVVTHAPKSSWYGLNQDLFPGVKQWQGAHWGLYDVVGRDPEIFPKLVKLLEDVPQ